MFSPRVSVLLPAMGHIRPNSTKENHLLQLQVQVSPFNIGAKGTAAALCTGTAQAVSATMLQDVQ